MDAQAEASRRSGDEGPVVLNEMDNRERERYSGPADPPDRATFGCVRYLDFMIHHDFDFEQDENGEYVATFKVVTDDNTHLS